ncbi:MAG TPA: putative toxin-antitoxin system toxin component, PIN family [Ferruginibacter sp.]|nr:putative toxin-antitoxin system toxin component, PIN family [Ferruginibacter sp.]
MIRAVLDTNIIIASLFSSSPYHRILSDLFLNKYIIIVTNDILLEYEEKIAEKFGKEAANATLEALLQSNSVIKTEVFFTLFLVKADPDDNKFSDAAFSSNADLLVTNDRHFNILKQISFPVIKTIDIDGFLKMLTNL